MNSLPCLKGFKILQLWDPISTTNAQSFIIQGPNNLIVQNFSFHRRRLKMNTYLQCGFECRVHLQRCLHNETRPLNSWNFKISEKEQESSAPAAARGVRPAEKWTHMEGTSVLLHTLARSYTSQLAVSTQKRTRSRVKGTVAQYNFMLYG